MAATSWEDARRLEAWAGEMRVNLIRSVALVLFYATHLLDVYVWQEKSETAASQVVATALEKGGVRGQFHIVATAVVLVWASGILVLHVCLNRRWVPPQLKFLATTWDLLLTTILVMASPEGPRSPLMLLYFVVLAAAPLRLSLPLVWFTTFGSMLCALAALGYYIFKVSWQDYFDPAKHLRIPYPSEILFLLALGAVGLLAGQVVRQARRLVQGYPVRVQAEKEAA